VQWYLGKTSEGIICKGSIGKSVSKRSYSGDTETPISTRPEWKNEEH
jgi:hypothetical protein